MCERHCPSTGIRSGVAILLAGLLFPLGSAVADWVEALEPSGAHNILATQADHRVALGQSGLRDAGFTGAPAGQNVNPNNSDELRVLERGAEEAGAPKVRILMDGEGRFVYWTGGPFLESAEDYVLDLQDTLVVITTRSTEALTWRIPGGTSQGD